MMNILLVEDDEDDKMLFRNAVQKISKDIKCEFSSNGRDALRYLNECVELPSVIFMDINMPMMNGLECLEEIKKDSRLKDIPIIILSTSTNKKEMDLIKYLGAAYIEKGSSFDLLRKTILDFLSSFRVVA
jgi:CheY-like chemotaxis protein